MQLLTSETELPAGAFLIGTDWEDSNEFSHVLSNTIEDHITYGDTIFSLKRDHYDADGLFQQWSRDYYAL